MTTRSRADDPGSGLEGNGSRALTYADLKSLALFPDRREPEREVELHITGNMECYMWSFDGNNPYDIVAAIELSRATLRKMHQNLWWAVGYNVIAFPIAAGVFYPFVLSPEVAALSMPGSTLVLAINALMLKRTKLAGIRSQTPRADKS